MKEKYELAYEDYLSGMKYKDIAAKYDVSISAVKSWKSRYWKDKKSQPKKPKVATKKVARKIADEMINNGELDEDKQLFCIYYLKYFNATKAYMKVKPDVTYGSAMVGGSKWLKLPAVQEEINRLKKELYTEALIEPFDIVQQYIDIARSDITDYVDIKDNTVCLKDGASIDGTLIQEVRQSKKGISIKLIDKTKAIDWLAKHMNMANEEQKAKIELLKAQIKSIVSKNDEVEEEYEDDGFLDALNSSVKEDWEDEEKENSSI